MESESVGEGGGLTALAFPLPPAAPLAGAVVANGEDERRPWVAKDSSLATAEAAPLPATPPPTPSTPHTLDKALDSAAKLVGLSRECTVAVSKELTSPRRNAAAASAILWAVGATCCGT